MNWLTSNTIQGLLISLVGFIAARLGWGDAVLPADIAATVEAIIQLGGLALAAYGRKKAAGPL